MRPPRARDRWQAAGGRVPPPSGAGSARLLTRLCRRLAGKRPPGAGGPHRARVSSGLRRPPGTPAAPRRWLPNAPAGHAEPAGRTHRRPGGQRGRYLRRAAPELTGVGRRLRRPRGSSCGGRVLYFCCSSGDLSKGKDVEGGGGGCRRVAGFGRNSRAVWALARPTRPSAGGESDWGRERTGEVAGGGRQKGRGFNGIEVGASFQEHSGAAQPLTFQLSRSLHCSITRHS